MQKKFITNLALLLVMNLAIKPFWILGIEPKVQVNVGDAAYGEYFALFNFSFLLNILLDFGITNFNNKNIAQNNHLLTKHFSGLFVLKLFLGVIYIIATLGIGYIVGYDFRFIRLLLILGFNQFLISMINYLRSNLLGMHLFKTDSVISILDRFIMIAFAGLLLWTNIAGIDINIMVFVYIQTLAYLLTAIIAFIMVMRKTASFRLTWNWPFSLMILKKSFPFAILVLLMTFYNRFDAVMIERVLGGEKGAYEAGVYAKGFRLLDAANMIAYLFSLQLLPIFSKMIKQKEAISDIVRLSFSLLVTPAFIVAVMCFTYSYELTSLINYGNTNSQEVFSVLMFCFVAISTTYIYGTLLTANGNLKELNIMAISGLAINLGLNLILIPKMNALGAAYSSLITQMITATVQVLIAAKMFKIKTDYAMIGKLLLFVPGIAILAYFSRNMHSNWMINFGVMSILAFTVAFLTRLISVKSIYRILKYG